MEYRGRKLLDRYREVTKEISFKLTQYAGISDLDHKLYYLVRDTHEAYDGEVRENITLKDQIRKVVEENKFLLRQIEELTGSDGDIGSCNLNI
jgi:hypothetical protein